MPELPEVEALRISLLPLIVGQKIRQAKVLMPKLVSSNGTSRTPCPAKKTQFEEEVKEQTILEIKRKAKNLIFTLENGSQILIHFKMSGQLVYRPNSSDRIVWGGHPIELSHTQLPNKHTHIIFELDKGKLFYNDVRQFGYLLFFPDEQTLLKSGHFDRLGLEPLSDEFNLKTFTEKLKTKKGNLKKMFLDQQVVVGLGNIYADEVCFVAGVRPTRNIESLKSKEIRKLYEAIKAVLPEAIKDGGSSVANYLLGDGQKGNYAKKHYVYNRGGLNCKVCGFKLVKLKLAGRTTVYCPICQK